VARLVGSIPIEWEIGNKVIGDETSPDGLCPRLRGEHDQDSDDDGFLVKGFFSFHASMLIPWKDLPRRESSR
jgi:hypothetical protein